MRQFAAQTTTPVSKTRGEIDKLLRDWGAKAIQWTDEYEADKCTLRFVWRFEERDFFARISIHLPTEDVLSKKAYHGGLKKVHTGKLQKLMEHRGRSEHRLLLLWIKAALNAVAEGIVSAEAIFLPFLEGKDGMTVAEMAVPRLAQLQSGSALRLLGTGDR